LVREREKREGAGEARPSAGPHPGRSVLRYGSVRFFGTYANSGPQETGTDRFLKKLGTEEIRYR
jgi:hypothetical protein